MWLLFSIDKYFDGDQSHFVSHTESVWQQLLNFIYHFIFKMMLRGSKSLEAKNNIAVNQREQIKYIHMTQRKTQKPKQYSDVYI